MGMARHDAGSPLLVDPFVTRGSTGVIFFLDNVNNDESVNNYGNNKGGGMDADLSIRLQYCIALAKHVSNLGLALTTLPKYQQHAMK